MNVRPTESSALAADKFASATDLFAATSVFREMGPIPFERLLRSNPTPASTAPPTSSPSSSTAIRSSAQSDVVSSSSRGANNAETRSDPADDSRAESRESECALASTPEQRATDEPKSPATDESRSAIEAAIAEESQQESEVSQQDPAAESLLLAAVVPTEQPLADPDVKSVEVEPASADVIAEGTAKPQPGSSPTVDAIRAELAQSNSQLESASLTDPAQSIDATATTLADQETVQAADDATANEAQDSNGEKLLAKGIGVLPSALNLEAQSRPASQSSTGNRSRLSQRGRDVTEEHELNELTANQESKPPTAQDEIMRRVERGQSALLRGLATNDGADTSTTDPNVTLRAPAPIDVPVLVDKPNLAEPAPATSNRTDAATSGVANSTPNTSQPGQPLATPHLTSKLPMHALVRGAQHSSASDASPNQIDTIRILQRVARAFEAAREQGGEVRLRLSPPELGALRVEVSVVEQGLIAKVEAETPEARLILLENLPSLRERLAEQGVKLERFDVDLSQQRSGQEQRQAFEQPTTRQPLTPPRTARPDASPIATDAGPKPLSSANLIQDRRLNVVI